MNYIFELLSEDITDAAGGPMGSRSFDNWRRYFRTEQKAKKAAEKDFGRSIRWVRSGSRWQSPDLGHVQYTIRRLKVE